ncbi:MAG: hypothetical protein M5U15_07135 [Kiritimatiellae bacterium]|nr:hypothetical protein [Kiritimatiellia bacterium]
MAENMNGSLVAAILSPQPEIAQTFVATLCGADVPKGQVQVSGLGGVVVEVPPIEPLEVMVEHVKSADFSVMLLRFVDDATLEIALAIMRALPPNVQSAVHIAIVREQGEGEFKMSCPQCGQKLMIKDALAFRRTQCPRCKHPFTIPGQADLVRRKFLIPQEGTVSRVLSGDVESCLNALRVAHRQSGGRRAEMKSTTMRLDSLIIDNAGGTIS